ncbi:MAG: Hpt domain-containing protein [Xanthobacteraceae bacterium]|nr:Hpt domain-containing protein [Xanthobacteraceae bacterium]
MSSEKPEKPKTVAFRDHEVITPDTRKLRRTLRNAAPGEPDPVEAAERALERLSADFANWMQSECGRLDAARRAVKNEQLSPETSQALFLAAHDIKGAGKTFGFPEVARAADSLCRLLEHTPDLKKIPMSIVDQHVDAIRAIVREHARADIGAIAGALTAKLRTVTDEFLVVENQDRPEILKVIQSPALPSGE